MSSAKKGVKKSKKNLAFFQVLGKVLGYLGGVLVDFWGYFPSFYVTVRYITLFYVIFALYYFIFLSYYAILRNFSVILCYFTLFFCYITVFYAILQYVTVIFHYFT